MKTKNNNTTMHNKNILRIMEVVGLILLIPLFGNIFIDGWNWSIGDFVFAFVALFTVGFSIDFVARKLTNSFYKAIVITTIMLAFIFIWVEVATDGISRIIVSLF